MKSELLLERVALGGAPDEVEPMDLLAIFFAGGAVSEVAAGGTGAAARGVAASGGVATSAAVAAPLV